MPGEPPLDGSPDPVGTEPDPYDIEDDHLANRTRVPIEELADSYQARSFDLASDAYNPRRYDEYLDWAADVDENRATYIVCPSCRLALRESNFPPEGGLQDRWCFDCLDGTPAPGRARRDPSATLKATRAAGFEVELTLPTNSAEPETLTWQLLDSPLREANLCLFTAGRLGVILEESPDLEPLEQYPLTEWERAYINLHAQALSVLEDLGFTHPIRTGVSKHLDIPWRPFGQRWRFLILGR